MSSDWNPQHVEDRLERRAAARKWKAIAGLVFGVPLCLVAPLMLGTIFWFVTGMLREWYAWHWFFLALAVITIPLLFRLELQTHGDYLSMAARSGEEFPGADRLAAAVLVTFGAGAGMLAHSAMDSRGPSGFVEIFLLGPRCVISGRRHLRHRRVLCEADVSLAAAMLGSLLKRDKGMAIEDVRAPGADGSTIRLALAWLSYYGWIGVSKDEKRVFVFSETRDFLGQPT